MNIFIDTSALVKYFHEEEGTSSVTEIINDADNDIYISELARLEFVSALHRRFRRGEINQENLEQAIDGFFEGLSCFHVEQVSRLIMQEAELLLLQYGKTTGLRTLDSIHLATFFLLNEADGLFVTSDTTCRR